MRFSLVRRSSSVETTDDDRGMTRSQPRDGRQQLKQTTRLADIYGVPFSHLFTALEISPIELEISTIVLQISTIHLEISPNRLNCRYLQLNWRYLQFNWRYLQFNCRYLQFDRTE